MTLIILETADDMLKMVDLQTIVIFMGTTDSMMMILETTDNMMIYCGA